MTEKVVTARKETTMTATTCCEGCTEHFHSIAEIQAHADALGVPGPDVAEHEEGREDGCFCRLCLSYS